MINLAVVPWGVCLWAALTRIPNVDVLLFIPSAAILIFTFLLAEAIVKLHSSSPGVDTHSISSMFWMLTHVTVVCLCSSDDHPIVASYLYLWSFVLAASYIEATRSLSGLLVAESIMTWSMYFLLPFKVDLKVIAAIHGGQFLFQCQTMVRGRVSERTESTIEVICFLYWLCIRAPALVDAGWSSPQPMFPFLFLALDIVLYIRYYLLHP